MQLLYLKSMNYNTISLDDFIKWQNKEISLDEKNVLIIVENKNDDLDNILSTYDYQINYYQGFDTRFIDFNKPASIDNGIDNIPIYLMKQVDANKYNDIVRKKSFEETYDYDELAEEIPVLNYHFIGSCTESICLKPEKFEEHLKYFKENNYKTLTVQEFIDWKAGKIDLPKKSVLLTFDDGAMGTSRVNGNYLMPLLEKYDMHATLFLITSFWDASDYVSPNLEVESHTDNIHDKAGCTYKAKYMSKDEIKEDMQKSIDIVKSNKIFAYPCYYYNDNFIAALKELGYKGSFVGGEKSVKRSNNDFLMPRYVVDISCTIDDLKYYLGEN